MDTILSDVRWAVRTLARRPGLSALAIITIALGVGANSAIFSVIRAVLLRPLPYDQPDRVVAIYTRGANQAKGEWLSEPEIWDIRASAGLAATGGYSTAALNLTGDGEPERIIAVAATADLFDALGTVPLHGRVFDKDEDLPNQPPVIVLGYDLWRRRFLGRPDIVGTSIEANGQKRLVLGVMREDFVLPLVARGTVRADAYIPIAWNRAEPDGRGSHYVYTLGRLNAGQTVAQLNGQLDALSARLTQQGEYHAASRFGLWAEPVQEQVVGNVRGVLYLLFGSVGLVLLIACANVANLLLGRAEDRRREFAVRAAIGADRGRIVRQLVVEHLALGLTGGTLGLFLAGVAARFLVRLDPTAVPRATTVQVDAGVLAFTVGLSAVAALLFGLAPALLASRTPLNESLKEGSRGATGGLARRRVRRGLIAAEVALAVLLLAGAGLTLRTFAALLSVNPGFDPRGALTARVSLPAGDYPDSARVTTFFLQATERIKAIPGVTAVGAVRVLPLAATIGDWTVNLEGRTPPVGDDFDGDWQIVTPGYFDAMGVKLLGGRFLTDADRMETLPVVVINQTMARQYWPSESALGKRFRIGDQTRPWIEIVGVVADEKHAGLSLPVNRKFYRPHAQWTQSGTGLIRALTFVVRTAGEPTALISALRGAIRSLDARLPLSDVRTLDDVLNASIARQRFTMLLLALFAATALVLAAIGVYGVITHWVSERTSEIGIRMALGATRGEVVRLVVGEGMAPALTGIAAGGAVSLAAAGVMRGMLFGVAARDPLTFVAIAILLVVVAAAASWIPAQRAARLPPIVALQRS